MADIPSLAAIDIAGFAATNIDDIFLLIMFFSNSSMTFPARQVVVGQYIGIGLLVAISLLGFFFSMAVPTYIIGLLGIVPIVIGIRKILALFTKKIESNLNQVAKDRKKSNLAFAAVASVTFSNGGDNIGVYTPLFAKYNTVGEIAVLAAIFMAMTGLWCIAAHYLVNNPLVASKIRYVGHIVLPFILIGLGPYILGESFAFYN
jgi:cadmium resistance protein CadD (predicted permease)